MSDLFDADQPVVPSLREPLAVRMRPRTLDEIVGQEHLLGPGRLLRRAIAADRITSIVLYGPPGTGKTATAHVIARTVNAAFEPLNATAAGVAELRLALTRTRERERRSGLRTILFIDEIHRFTRAQQDVLMPDVERGNPILIGATTENPFFSINAALLSRSLVCELKPLTEAAIRALLDRALRDEERGLGKLAIRADDDALAHLAKVSDGDARRALSALEVAALTTPPDAGGTIGLTRAVMEESIQKKAVVYDRQGDAHYDTISAFIKSLRGSDPDAALYWLAKMLYAGEDARFIARRLVICASEDVGNADPQALGLAVAAFQASEFIGLPEARIPLAQATAYIACAPKSNAAYLGVEKALEDVKAGRTLEVPQHLKDASYQGAKQLGRGEGYQYAHDFPDHYAPQDYRPAEARQIRYYAPTDQGAEKAIRERLARLRQRAPQSD